MSAQFLHDIAGHRSATGNGTGWRDQIRAMATAAIVTAREAAAEIGLSRQAFNKRWKDMRDAERAKK